ncbi:MAG: glycosyltransferase [Gammaproteobacteria bacterium]|nr:glycosyltransferase [Gammaproteobacteria bacterium]
MTETFILRDLVVNHQAGHEMKIFHLTRYRDQEVVHGFAEETLNWSVTLPYFWDQRVMGACWRALTRQPLVLLSILWTIIREFLFDPVTLVKALAVVPKSLAAAENLVNWNANHVHAEFAGHPGTSAWIIGRMTGLPFSISCHAHDIFRTQGLLKQKLTEASFVRCISEFNKRFLIDHFPELASHLLPVIHVGVDTARIQAGPVARSKPFEILFIGSMEYRKGISQLLEALAALPESIHWSCNIVGGGPEFDRLQQEKDSLGLQERVTFHGSQPFEAVSKFMTDCQLLVVPSIEGPGGRSEGIPTVIMEALAHQRPVIASRLSGIPELIIDGDTGYLVPPGDVLALTNAIRHVHDNPIDAAATAERGRAIVEREFDMNTNAQARLALYLQHSRT